MQVNNQVGELHGCVDIHKGKNKGKKGGKNVEKRGTEGMPGSELRPSDSNS